MIRTLIALCFVLIAGSAQAANCYWVGGTGNSTNPARWSSSTGGAGSTCAGSGGIPGSADVAIFDGASGGGVVTFDANMTLSSSAANAFQAGTFTGTIDFAGFNVSAQSFSLGGTGARKFIGGSGTLTVAGTGGSWDLGVTTNLDPTSSFASATIRFVANPTQGRTFAGGNLTYGTLEIADTGTTSRTNFSISGTPTITTFTPTAVRWITLTSNVTITNGFSLAGTSTEQVLITSNDNNGTARTLTVGGAATMSWVAIAGVTKAGAGSITATNSFNLGNNSGVTISTPSGGGSGGKIIGGGI